MNLLSIAIIAIVAIAFAGSLWQIVARRKKGTCNGCCEGCAKSKNCNIK